MTKKWKRLCRFAWVSMLIAILVFPGGVIAKGSAEVEAYIPVSVEVTNVTDAVNTNFEVTIEPDGSTPNAPMPEEKALTFIEEGELSFGPITYTRPEDYHYIIRQTKGSDPNYIYDETVYNVTVRITNGENGGYAVAIWAVKNGGSLDSKQDEIIFENTWIRPNPPEPTATPTPTATPEPTATPMPTATPEPTATPDPTTTPDPTITPEVTGTPAPTTTPGATETPEPTTTPGETTPGETNPTVSPSGDNNQPTDKNDTTGSQSEKKSKNPKTGDETPIALFTTLAVVAVLGILYILRRRRKE